MIRNIPLLAAFFQAPKSAPFRDDYTSIPRHADKMPSCHIRTTDLFGQRWTHYLERTTRHERRQLEAACSKLYRAGFQQTPNTNWKTKFKLLRYEGLATLGFNLVYTTLQRAARQNEFSTNPTPPICTGNLPLVKAFVWLYTDFSGKKYQPEVREVIRWCQQLDGRYNVKLGKIARTTSFLLDGKSPRMPKLDPTADLDESIDMAGFEALLKNL